MIVGPVGVIAVRDKASVAAVDRSGEAVDQLAAFLLGDEFIDGHCVQSCRLAHTSSGVGRTGSCASTGRKSTASGLSGWALYQR